MSHPKHLCYVTLGMPTKSFSIVKQNLSLKANTGKIYRGRRCMMSVNCTKFLVHKNELNDKDINKFEGNECHLQLLFEHTVSYLFFIDFSIC